MADYTKDEKCCDTESDSVLRTAVEFLGSGFKEDCRGRVICRDIHGLVEPVVQQPGANNGVCGIRK